MLTNHAVRYMTGRNLPWRLQNLVEPGTGVAHAMDVLRHESLKAARVHGTALCVEFGAVPAA